MESIDRQLASELLRIKAVLLRPDAAGGLVSNRREDVLLISRNGLWDLPKGHQENGEDIRVTALREVQEETGVGDLELRGLICVTDHCYRRDGVWHLKHTWWYHMSYLKPVDLIPQTEEDITKAAWVAKSSLPPYLKNAYTAAIAGQASGSIDLLELAANDPVALLDGIGRDVDPLESRRSLEHLHQRTDVAFVGKMELDSIGVCQCCLFGSTYYNGPAVKVYLVHIPQTYKKERTR